MSKENVELARQYFKAFNAGGLDGTEHLRHPQIELYDPPDLPDADRYVGEAAFRKRIESYLAVGWDGQFRVQEYLDAGEEVVMLWQMTGRSPLGDFPLDMTIAFLCLFERGKLRRVRWYTSRAEGLEAAGLRE
jgi:ketosteroid isomerase-like protein